MLSYLGLIIMIVFKWEKSPIRNEWLQKGRKLVEADPDVQKMTGLEFLS